MNENNNENDVKIEHGRWYVCIKDYYAGGNLRAKRGSVVEAKRGMSMMGLKDASTYFRYATPEEIETGYIQPKFIIGDVMRTKEEAKNGITSGLPVVVYVDCFNYHCNNETIPLTEQEDYEYPPMNRQMKFDRECVKHPNFECHDWIVNNETGKLVGRIAIIIRDPYGEDCAILSDNGDGPESIGSEYMSRCHKWTLDDASDGDYLTIVLKKGYNGPENKIIHGRLDVEKTKFYSDRLCLFFTYDETSSMPFRTVTWIFKDEIQMSEGNLLVFPMSKSYKEQMQSDMANNNICFDEHSRQLIWPKEVVKHKFEPGDVVTDGTEIRKILRIINVGNYVYETDKEPKSIAYVDRTFHLFDFEDMKDGDIVRVSIRHRENHETMISIVGKFRSYDRETKLAHFYSFGYRYFGDKFELEDAMLAITNAMDFSTCDYVVTPAEKSDIEFFNSLKTDLCTNDNKKVVRKSLMQKDVDELVCRFKNSSDNFKDKRVSDIYRRGVLDAIALINDQFGEQFEKFGISISKRILKRDGNA